MTKTLATNQYLTYIMYIVLTVASLAGPDHGQVSVKYLGSVVFWVKKPFCKVDVSLIGLK